MFKKDRCVTAAILPLVEGLECRRLMHAGPHLGADRLLINVGGSAYTDAKGQVWSADHHVSGGTASTGAFAVANTTNDRLYYNRRWGAFRYTIPLADGQYSLKLHFTDPLYTTSGKRKFNVAAEGRTILSNFDIAAAGGGKAAISRSFNLTVSGGALDLAFAKVLENPILSAIEIAPQPAPPPPQPPPGPAPAAFTRISWSTRAPSPIGRAEALSATVGDRMYVFGGFSGSLGPVTRSDVYNPATNAWTRVKDLPQRITHAGVAAVGRNIYIAGGYVGHAGRTGYGQTFGSRNVWRYNVDTNTYTAMPQFPAARAGGGLVAVNNELHYFGGDDINRRNTGAHYVLNLANPSAGWRTSAALPLARSHMGYVNFGGKVYAIGGQTGNDAGLITRSAVHVWDPASPGVWKQVASMPRALSHISGSTFVMGNRIIVAGGESAHGRPVRDVYAYTPSTNKWVALSPLPIARFSGVATSIGGSIYFTTGNSSTLSWKGTPVV